MGHTASVVKSTSAKGNSSEPDSVSTEKACGGDAEQGEKGKKKQINEWESHNHLTYHSKWYGTAGKVVHGHRHKRWSCPKRA